MAVPQVECEKAVRAEAFSSATAERGVRPPRSGDCTVDLDTMGEWGGKKQIVIIMCIMYV